MFLSSSLLVFLLAKVVINKTEMLKMIFLQEKKEGRNKSKIFSLTYAENL